MNQMAASTSLTADLPICLIRAIRGYIISSSYQAALSTFAARMKSLSVRPLIL